MDIKKSNASSVIFLLLILCLVSVQIHAHTGRLSLYTKNREALISDPSFSAQNDSGNGQAGWRGAGYGSDLGNGLLTVLGGVAGNVVGMYAGAYLGFVVPSGPIGGALAGSTLGSALGVYLAGSSCGRGGNFGAALGGSLLGELAALGLAFAIHTEDAPFLAGFLILPPIGAALAFNSSRRSRSFQAGNGLLNLAEGKLGLGVPDIQVRPLSVPGLNVKPELQFNVRVLSVEL